MAKKAISILLVISILFTFGALISVGAETNEYVSDAYYNVFHTQKGGYTLTCRLPKILLDSEDARIANQEIINRFSNSLSENQAAQDGQSFENIHEISYEYFVNNDILSLVIKDSFVATTSIREYSVYNFNLISKKRIDRNTLLQTNRLSWEKIQDKIKEIYHNNLPYENYVGTANYNTVKSYYDESIKAENIDKTEMFFGSNKSVKAICYWKSLAGSGPNRFRYDMYTLDGNLFFTVNYSLNLTWGKDNFSFENTIDDLPLIKTNNGKYNYNMDYSLFNHLDFSYSDILAMKNSLQPCGGVCFGMSVMAFKNATNQLSISSLESGKSTLYQLTKPKDNGTENVRNAIGLYQSSCASSKYHNARDRFINLSTHDKLSIMYNKLINIEDTRRPVVLDYAWISDETKHNNNEEAGVSAHAVLAYGIENEYAPYEINGKRYEYKVWIINPNNSFNSHTDIATASQYCMYLDENLDEFCIPIGGTRTDAESYYSLVSTPDGEMNHLGDANLQFATDDYDLLPATTSDTGNNAIITVSNQAAVINGHLISGYKGNDSSIIARSFTPCGHGANMNLTINKNNLPDVKTVSDNQIIGYISERTATYITNNKDSVVRFNDESINLKNSHGTYQIEIAVNESNFNDVILRGSENQSEVNVEVNAKGLLISGDAIDGMTIASNTDSITLDTNEESVIINEIDNRLVVLEDINVGDVNLDGTVSISDATEVQKHLAEYINLNDTQKTIADTNGDGYVTISDATEIQKYLAEFIDHFGQTENTSISLNTSHLSMSIGEKKTLTANVNPSVDSSKIEWVSNNETVATITNGVIEAKSIGSTTIIASYNGKTAQCIVTVTPIEASSVSLNKSNLSLIVGNTYQLSATINPSNTTNKAVTWSCNYPNIATVDSYGMITAKGVGSATVTVKTNNGKTAQCMVTVYPILPESVKISNEHKEVDVGESFTLSAMVYPNNATNKTLTWSSSDSSIATVSQSGVVKTIHNGKTTISATTTNGKKSSCELIVYTPISGAQSLSLFMSREPNGYARLTKDFSVDLLPLCNDEFKGCLNGDNHTITYSYTASTNNATSDVCKALIAKTNGAIIQNIKTAGSIDHTVSSDSFCGNCCAGLVANAQNTVFENCKNTANIKGAFWGSDSAYGLTGGITAFSNNCVFIGCSNSGQLESFTNANKESISVIGGISGQSVNSQYYTCNNTGTLFSKAFLDDRENQIICSACSGGISGVVENSILDHCVCNGTSGATIWSMGTTQIDSFAASGGLAGIGNAAFTDCSSNSELFSRVNGKGKAYENNTLALEK